MTNMFAGAGQQLETVCVLADADTTLPRRTAVAAE
jgi:hypothetical protein